MSRAPAAPVTVPGAPPHVGGARAVTVELVIRDGTVLDGSGGEPFVGDLAIEDGRIATISRVPPTACPAIDAAGLCVAPTPSISTATRTTRFSSFGR